MQGFINNIYNFIRQIISYITQAVGQYESAAVVQQYLDFLNKNVFYETSLIGINITYFELLKFFIPIFLTFFIICLFVRFFLKLLGLFRLD